MVVYFSSYLAYQKYILPLALFPSIFCGFTIAPYEFEEQVCRSDTRVVLGLRPGIITIKREYEF